MTHFLKSCRKSTQKVLFSKSRWHRHTKTLSDPLLRRRYRYSNWQPKWIFAFQVDLSISPSFLNRNGWNLVSRHIFWRCLDTQNFSSLSLLLSELSNLRWRYLVISTKSFISLKVQVIESWNFVCPNVFKKCAWRPNFIHFGWEITNYCNCTYLFYFPSAPTQHDNESWSIRIDGDWCKTRLIFLCFTGETLIIVAITTFVNLLFVGVIFLCKGCICHDFNK